MINQMLRAIFLSERIKLKCISPKRLTKCVVKQHEELMKRTFYRSTGKINMKESQQDDEQIKKLNKAKSAK